MTKTSTSTLWCRRVRKELIKWFGGKCQFYECDETWSENLQFAHIWPTGLVGRGRSSWKRYKDIRRNAHAYILLCKTHHREFDSNESKLKDDEAILETVQRV